MPVDTKTVFTRKFLENVHLKFTKHYRLLNSLLFNFGFFFVCLEKYQVLLIDRRNRPLAFFGQRILFFAYVLSTKPIPGIYFVHNHYAGQLVANCYGST